MKFQIFYGTDRAAMRRFCRQAAINNSPTTVIVPEQFSLSGESGFLDLQRQGVQVSSFRRLAHELFEQTGSVGEYVAGTAKVILMERALQDCASSLTVYRGCVEKRGFAGTLCQTVAEFKHTEITPEQLLEGQKNASPLLQNKLNDLACIYQAYQTLLDQTGRDADDDLTRLCRLLEEGKYPCSDRSFLLYYFTGFTVQERCVIRALSERSRQMMIGMITEECTDGQDEKLCFWSTKRNIASFSDLSPQLVYVPGDEEGRARELVHLSNGYFSYPTKVWKGETPGITVMSAANPYEEMQMVGAEMLRLCREEGYRFREMGVVARGLDRYEDAIEQAFSLFEIPYFTDGKTKVTAHPLVSFLLSVRDVFEYQWNYEAVFHYVKSCFSPIPRELGDVLENFALAYGIFGNIWTSEERWQAKLDRAFADPECGFCREQLETARERLVTPLMRLRTATRGRHLFREHARALFGLLEEADVYSVLTEKTTAFRQGGQGQKSEEYRQLWTILLRMLDQVVTLAGEETGSFTRFMDCLEEGFEACSVGSVPPGLDEVAVSSADRFVGEQIRCLFLIGVNEGEFPAAGTDSGLLDQNDRDYLESIGLETAFSRQKSAYMEQEIIYKLLSVAQDRIVFSYRRGEVDQTAKAPSQIIHRVQELFPGLLASSMLPQVSAPGYTFIRMAEQPEQYDEARAWFTARPDYHKKLRLLEQEGDLSQVTLSPETVKDLYPDGIYASVSRLERFRRCPFSFHAAYQLKARPRKQYRLGAPDTGSFLHDCLEKAARTIDESHSLQWETVTREECGIIMDRIVEEGAELWFGGLLVSSPRYRYLAARLKRLLSKNLYFISLHFKNGLFRPVGYELSFRTGGDLPPVTLHLPDGQAVKLTGKVDRADTYKTPDGAYIRIIDYKSGPKDLRLNDVYYGLNLQLVTYLDALCKTDEPAGVFYFNVMDPYTRTETALEGEELINTLRKNYKMKGLVLSSRVILEAMDEHCEGGSDLIPAYVKKDGSPGGNVASAKEFSLLRKQVRGCLRSLSAAISRGKADVLPVKTKREFACTYCDYAAVCGYEGRTGKCLSLPDLSHEELMKRMEEMGDG